MGWVYAFFFKIMDYDYGLRVVDYTRPLLQDQTITCEVVTHSSLSLLSVRSLSFNRRVVNRSINIEWIIHKNLLFSLSYS